MNEELAGLTDPELEAQLVPLMRRRQMTERACELAEEAVSLAHRHNLEVRDQYEGVLRTLNARYRAIAEAAQLRFVDPPLLVRDLGDDGE